MNKFYTSIKSHDGFGAQYQRIIQTFVYCKKHDLQFAYTPLHRVEHNYDNDNEYNNKLEELMNIKNNIVNVEQNMITEELDYGSIVRHYFEENINACCESEYMDFIKNCFWQNKNRNYFDNNKLNIALHIRRENTHDKGMAGPRATTPNRYYLKIMNSIREKYNHTDDIINNNSNNKELLFHIYSQGDITQFEELVSDDVKFYLNYDIIESFIGMVSADILVMSPSSFSYVAGMISDGEVYYKKFWHNPRKNWIVSG